MDTEIRFRGPPYVIIGIPKIQLSGGRDWPDREVDSGSKEGESGAEKEVDFGIGYWIGLSWIRIRRMRTPELGIMLGYRSG